MSALQWWTPLCRNWSSPAALCAQSLSSHTYHTPSKINFPFRPRFPARLSWEKAFLTPRSVLMVQSSASKTRTGKIKTSHLPQQKKAKQQLLTLWLLLMMQKETGSLLRDTFFPPYSTLVCYGLIRESGKCSTGPLTADWCICSMVSAAGGNYQALSELPLHQCATGSGMPAKLSY